MADSTEISWTDKTWNPWWGCGEIAPECGQHAPTGGHGLCYAAVFASRGLQPAHAGVAVNGKWTGEITRSGPAVWAAPLKWPAGSLVFTCSMSDFWHENVPLPMLDEALDVIDRTPHLIYQMLTKRPGNVQRRLDALKRRLSPNVWIGATIGHVASLPLLKPLRAIDATLRFLSCEPLLTGLPGLSLDGIGWLIAGGQSGRDAVPSHPNWFRHLRDRCLLAGVPFHFKQWGEFVPWTGAESPSPSRRFPDGEPVVRVGKKAAGAMLDGREWREFPARQADAR